MQAPAAQHLPTLSEVAARTKRSTRTWRRLIARGEVGIIGIAGCVAIPGAELERFLSEQNPLDDQGGGA